jgi:hypothetical protein
MIRKMARKAAAPKKTSRNGDGALTLRDIGLSLAESFDIPKSHANEYLAETITILTDHLKKGRKVRINGLVSGEEACCPQRAQSSDWRVDQDQGEQARCLCRVP